MLKDLLKEGGLYTIANLLTKGISLLLIPFYTAYFSPEDYGVIDILAVFGAFFNIIVSLQLNQSLARYVSEPTLKDSSKIKYASTAIWTVCFSYVIFTIVTISFSGFFIKIISSDITINKDVFIAAIISIFLSGIFYILTVYMRFIRQVKQVTSLSFINAFLAIILTIIFVLVFNLGLAGIFYATIISNFITIFPLVYLLRNKIDFYFNYSVLKLLLKYSMPLLPAALAYIAMNFTDRIFIKEFLGFNELGIYGIATKFSSIIGIVIMGFSTAIYPLIFEKHNLVNTKDELSKIFNYYIGIGTLSILILGLFSKETLYIFTNENYIEGYKVMPILYLTVFATGINMFSPGLLINKKTNIIAFLMILFFFINIILNYVLISKYKMVGAAYATLICTFLYEIVYFYFSQKLYPYDFKKLKTLIVILLSIILLYFGNKIEFNNVITTILLKVIILLIFIFTLFKMKFLTKQTNEKIN